jgi:hypothetical protein
MGVLLAFTPFLAYLVVAYFAGVRDGLVAGTAVAIALLLRDAVSRKTVKILEIGTAVLFGGLAAYAFTVGAALSIPVVRLCVDGGLLLIVLISMMVRRPFTLQYAREQVAREQWDAPVFVRTNYLITAVWAVAFAVMVAVDLAMIFMPNLPTRMAVIITIVALYGAIRFTAWYPARMRTKAAA